jgi:hypothetical protein
MGANWWRLMVSFWKMREVMIADDQNIDDLRWRNYSQGNSCRGSFKRNYKAMILV